jgi:hypothetical protein
MRLWLILLLFPLAVLAKSGSGGHAGASHGGTHAAGSTQSPSSGTPSSAKSAHGGGMHNRLDPRNVPPLAVDRKVHVQDCTQPIDWSAGNLKCK